MKAASIAGENDMEIGKVPHDVLNEKILGNIKAMRPEVLLRPSIGEDCSAVKVKDDEVIVLSTDPITGATANIGSIAVNINANDLASSGAEPIGIMVTLLLPPTTEVAEIQDMMMELSTACQEMNMEILGGHTEITDGVNRPIISVTAVGKAKKDQLVSTGGAMVGDHVVMTKWAGLEGTAIIAEDCYQQLATVLSETDQEQAKNLINQLSVLPESRIARELAIHGMHDVTEGGILGAAWEMAFCAGKGIIVEEDKIPILDVTRKICDHYQIDPMKLISSGSMLICTSVGDELVKRLESQGIPASIIGQITEEKEMLVCRQGQLEKLEEPEVDELYKVTK